LFRAYPVLAVNKHDDVLIGYSVFSDGTFASAAYSFRSFIDLPSTLQAEVALKMGEARYFKDFGFGSNRWGDYSNSVVDPLNDVDMWTIQEFAALPNVSDRWGTWWGKLELPSPDFTLAISNPTQTVFPGVTAIFNGTLTAIDGYNSSVTVTCQSGHTGVPGTCNGTTATPTAAGQAFSITASAASVQNFAFNIQGLGSDPANTTHVQAVTFNVVDFNLTAPTPNAVTVVKGRTSSAMVFQVQAQGSFSGAVTLDCEGLPAEADCQFAPSNLVTPTSGPPSIVTLTVSTQMTTPDFNGSITIIATSGSPAGERTQSFNLTVTAPTSTSDLGVDVFTFPGIAQFGAAVEFEVVVENLGPDAANNVNVDFTFVGARLKTLPSSSCSFIGLPCPCVSAGKTLHCSVAQLPADHPFPFLVFIPVVFEAQITGAITVSATVSSDSSDGNALNNVDTDSKKIRPRIFSLQGVNTESF
jgi:hypothetical protein